MCALFLLDRTYIMSRLYLYSSDIHLMNRSSEVIYLNCIHTFLSLHLKFRKSVLVCAPVFKSFATYWFVIKSRVIYVLKFIYSFGPNEKKEWRNTVEYVPKKQQQQMYLMARDFINERVFSALNPSFPHHLCIPIPLLLMPLHSSNLLKIATGMPRAQSNDKSSRTTLWV